ncbi:MAG: tape measure protein, partial [Tannerella sp.]|nr:tape measure protein [Tannerella sp.]
MKPVELVILMRDKTKQALIQAGQNVDGLSRDYDELIRVIRASEAEMERSGQVAKQVGSDYNGLFSILKKVGGAAALVGFGKEIIKVRSEFQNTEAMFKVFLGDAEKAASFMQELQKYAFNNVFEFNDLSQQAAQLLAYGTSAEKVVGVLDKLSNVAAGVNQPLEHFVDLYNKAQSKGKLDQIDVQQWSVMGDVVSYLADMLGLSKERVRALITEGKIGFKEMDQLLTSLTSEGGKFSGMMTEKMKTLGDSVGLLQDSLTSMFNELGQKSEDFLRGGILLANTLVENYEKIGKILLSLIATYGTYKAAVVLNMIVEQGWMTTQFQLGIVMAKLNNIMKALNATMMKNPAALIAAIIIGLVTAVWALHDSTTAEEQAQKKLNDTLENSKQKKETLKSKTNELISIIKDETQTIYAQVKAYEELKKAMPKEFGNMSREQIKNLKPEEISKIINQATDNIEFSDVEKMYSEALKHVSGLQKQIEGLYNAPDLGGNGKNIAIAELSKQLQRAQKEAEAAKAKLDEINNIKLQAEFDQNPLQERISYYETEISKLEQEKRQLDTLLLTNKEITNEWGQINWQTAGNVSRLQDIIDKINELQGKVTTLKSSENSG